jgi:hypothetical protein
MKLSSQSTAGGVAGGVAVPCFLPASANYAKMLGQNHFVEPNQYVLTFSPPVELLSEYQYD